MCISPPHWWCLNNLLQAEVVYAGFNGEEPIGGMLSNTQSCSNDLRVCVSSICHSSGSPV